MNLRDHAFAKAPYLLADEGDRASLPAGRCSTRRSGRWSGRPRVRPWEPTGGAIIDPDVLWSCVTCGACVEQCPVDIEHVDHIVDMRRYQVLVESNFPAELNQLFKGMENKGNPWNMSPTARMDWAQGLDFEVKVVGEDVESLDEVEWLFWVGCAGAYEDRAKKTTRAVAELLHMADVSFAVLGNGETCNGDPARRAGNEFVFQGLAQQNVETFKEYKVKKVVSTCAHCFNTLKNEYQRLRHRARGRAPHPAAQPAGARGQADPGRRRAPARTKRTITYHDPCYIGRHNGVYAPPRELLQVLPGADFVEMPRNSERSFCCGAGGARMWMEENLGTRINDNRTTEAVATGADQIAVGCPFCRVMLSDGLTAGDRQGRGPRGGRGPRRRADAARLGQGRVRDACRPHGRRGLHTCCRSSPDGRYADRTQRGGGHGGADEVADEVADEGDAPVSGGSSLFDLGSNSAEPAPEPEPEPEPAATTEPAQGGSLFDLGSSPPAAVPDEPEAKAEPDTSQPTGDVPAGGSLFDTAAPERPEPAPPPVEPVETEPATAGSLFDITPDEPEPAPRDDRDADEGGSPAPGAEEPPRSAGTEDEPAADPDHQAHTDAEINEAGSLFDL